MNLIPFPGSEAPARSITPTAAPVRRPYFRCKACLASMTLPATKERLYYRMANEYACDCGGSLEYLGEAGPNGVEKERVECACDDRCTFAKGPRCNCVCEGENHGAGMAAMIVVAVATGMKGVVRPCDDRRLAKLAAWQAEIAEVERFAVETKPTLRNPQVVDFYLRHYLSATRNSRCFRHRSKLAEGFKARLDKMPRL